MTLKAFSYKVDIKEPLSVDEKSLIVKVSGLFSWNIIRQMMKEKLGHRVKPCQLKVEWRGEKPNEVTKLFWDRNSKIDIWMHHLQYWILKNLAKRIGAIKKVFC